MPRRNGRSRSRHNIPDMSSRQEEVPSGTAGRDSPIAHRTRSRAILRGRATDHQLPGRPTRRGRQRADSSRRERSRSPVNRRVVPVSQPAPENNQRPPLSDRQGVEQPSCSICLVEYERGEDIGQLPCLHTFHLECIRTWLGETPTCPLCRAFVPQRLEVCVICPKETINQCLPVLSKLIVFTIYAF